VSGVLAALVAAAALRGSLEASSRLQLRVRDGAALAGPALDAELNPAVRLDVRARRFQLDLDYAPRFTRSLFGADAQPSIFHQGGFSARLQDRRASLSIQEDAGYGSSSFTALAADPGAASGPLFHLATLPRSDTVAYAWSRTGLLGRLALQRRWAITLSLEYALNGGTDARSREAIPFQTGLHGRAGAEYAPTRRDQLTSSVDAFRSYFSSGWEDTLVQGTLAWRRAWGRTLVSTVTGGVGYSTSHHSVTGEARDEAHPVGAVSVAYTPRSTPMDVGLSVRVSPVIDRLSGRVDERLESVASVAWRPTRALAIEGQLGAARSVLWDRPDAVALVYQGLLLSFRANDLLKFEGGARGAWTRLRGDDAPPLQWVTFVGMTFTAPTLRF
jgi:hypothetical protein